MMMPVKKCTDTSFSLLMVVVNRACIRITAALTRRASFSHRCVTASKRKEANVSEQKFGPEKIWEWCNKVKHDVSVKKLAKLR